ncbi:MAG TPA: ABC transporter permease [Tissierellia bacterium]|nr:ABC transporter permease [Tissierellia bacterium]
MLNKERKSNNAWNKLKRNKTAMFGLVIICIMVFMVITADIISPYDPNALDLGNAYSKPGVNGHIFGTDEFGRDLLSRIIYGSRISILVAVGATLVAGAIGLVLGLISGYSGGIIDSILMRIMDGMMAFPFVLLAILLMTILGSGAVNVVLAIGIANVPIFARIVRGQVLVVKNEEYCNAVRVLGASNFRLLFGHILPNIISPVIVQATLSTAGSIISEAALSFLGLGISPPTASWGNILRGGKDYLNTAPHIAMISGFFILITVLGFNLLGDGIRDVLDPKMKK